MCQVYIPGIYQVCYNITLLYTCVKRCMHSWLKFELEFSFLLRISHQKRHQSLLKRWHTEIARTIVRLKSIISYNLISIRCLSLLLLLCVFFLVKNTCRPIILDFFFWNFILWFINCVNGWYNIPGIIYLVYNIHNMNHILCDL